MIFQSIPYLLFLVAVFAIYWQLPRRPQNLFLLGASYLFYGYVHPWYLILIASTTVVDWACAKAISHHPSHRGRWLALSLTTNFSILVAFKYFGFFVDNLVGAARLAGLDLDQPHWHVLLPVGISFYTFQSASYVIDVYRRRTPAITRIDDYALFVSFFPQLVAGPIERASHLLNQITNHRHFNAPAIRSGVLLIFWGLLQKKAIADNAAVITNKIFALEQSSFPLLWAGVFAFGIQIYADFSAYTCIARGSARVLGFDLRQNFNHPWLASSPVDFWRRWHISLSTWFRDYVYIPLGGNRGSIPLVTRNILITFGLSGLWHGANWNFILWGLWHGSLVATCHLLTSRNPNQSSQPSRLRSVSMIILTFILVHIGWLLFREQDIATLGRAFSLAPWQASSTTWLTGLYLAAQAFLYGLPLWIWPWIENWKSISLRLPGETTWARTAIDGTLAAILLSAILLFSSPVGSDFIYFQF